MLFNLQFDRTSGHLWLSFYKRILIFLSFFTLGQKKKILPRPPKNLPQMVLQTGVLVEGFPQQTLSLGKLRFVVGAREHLSIVVRVPRNTHR